MLTDAQKERMARDWNGSALQLINQVERAVLAAAQAKSVPTVDAAALAAERERERALEDAANVCDAKQAIRAKEGFPREASTARALAKEVRALKDKGASMLTDQEIAAAVRPLYSSAYLAQLGLLDDIATARAVLAYAQAKPEGAKSGPSTWRHEGMSLRDYFAANALCGIEASQGNGGAFVSTIEGVASRAYELADAMLKARTGEQQ